MQRKGLVNEMARVSGLTKWKCMRVVRAYEKVVTEAIASGDSVIIHGFGKLETRVRGDYMGHDPITGKRYLVPAHKKVIFNVGSKLDRALNDENLVE